MTAYLMICGKARQRSPTAADMLAAIDGVEADFAGLSADADERVSLEQLSWADVICVMEARQKRRLTKLFGPALRGKRIVVLDVPDRFGYMQPELVALLSERFRRCLGFYFG